MSRSERQKLEAAIIYILKNQPIEILRLAKFVYLSDYLFAMTFGENKPITGNYYREKFGPVPNAFYVAINELLAEKIIDRTGNIITLKKDIAIKALSDEEIACLDKVIRDFKDVSISKLLKAAYSTEPMLKMQEREAALNVDKLVGEPITFENTKKHPLFDDDQLDIRFMCTPEFQTNLSDA
jgi:hypothetical protein